MILKISTMTLGTAQLGYNYGIANKTGMPADSTTFQMLEYADEHGITSYDTANAYGLAEKQLGRFFAQRKKPSIISKIVIPLSLDEQQVERHMFSIVENSLQALQINSLPGFLLHNPPVLKENVKVVYNTFEKMKHKGLIEKAGISLTDIVNEYDQFYDFLMDDLIEIVQFPVNIFDHRILQQDRIQELRSKQKVLLARSIYLQGSLFLNPDQLPNHLRAASEYWDRLRNLSNASGISISQLALSFVKDLGMADSIVLGAETLEQLKQNIELFQGTELEEGLKQRLLAEFKDVPEQVRNTILWPA